MYPMAYGNSYSGPRIGMLGATTAEDIVEKGKEILGPYVPTQPSQDMAGDVASQLAQTHGAAAGKAAAEQAWQNVRPFVIFGTLLLSGVVAIWLMRRK